MDDWLIEYYEEQLKYLNELIGANNIIDDTLTKNIQTINDGIQKVRDEQKKLADIIQQVSEQIEVEQGNIAESSLLYYILEGHNIKECRTIEEVCNLIDKNFTNDKKFNLGLSNITKYNSIGSFDKIICLLENEYEISYTYDDTVTLLKDINNYIDVSDEVDILSNDAKSARIRIIVLINILESVSNKLYKPKNKWNHMEWKKSYKILAYDSIKAIISACSLASSYDRNKLIKTFIPNRNIIVHESYVAYKGNYSKTLEILSDMVYSILYFRFRQYKYLNKVE